MNLSDKPVEQWPIDRLIEYAPNHAQERWRRRSDGRPRFANSVFGSRSWRNPTARSMMGISGFLKAARKQQAEFEFAEPGEREVEAERVQVAEFER